MSETDSHSEQPLHLTGARVQRANPIPLYLQVSEALRQAITAGELMPGEELPTEAQLCDLYGVSRITVRQAVAELLSEGAITRSRPRGPLVVSPTRILREVSELSGPFVDEVLAPGMRRRTEVISACLEAASPRPAMRLGIAAGALVCHIERLHLGDQIPLACQSSWLSDALVPGLLNHSLSGSLQQLCESGYGLQIGKKVQRISARMATTQESSLLNLDRRAPVLELERTAHLSDGRVLEYVVYTLRADRFTIVSELSRSS
jgi:GntR family transcriptional regulator